MARCNIAIDVDFTCQFTRCIKELIKRILTGNLNKKCIVYTNTVSSLVWLKTDLEIWLDMSYDIKGDVIVVQGDMEPEINFVSVC